MKKIAIIGFGSHVIKNILPAIERMDDLEISCIVVRDPLKYEALAKEHNLSVCSEIDPIKNDISWVYICTPISTHFQEVRKYLELEKNIICEKPLTDNPEKTKLLFEMAKTKHVQLVEVCMYQYHQQFKHLESFIDKSIDSLKCAHAKFTIPHLESSNVRYKKELGGGALLDVGYYPLSIMIYLFGMPNNILSTNFIDDDLNVDLHGSATLVYGTFYCLAEWGIGLPYSNEISLYTENKSLKYDRVFSKPHTYKTNCVIKEGFDTEIVDIGSDDQFVNMLSANLNQDTSEKDNSDFVYNLSCVLNEIRNNS